MSVSAFAFFSHSVSSAKTNITSATYSLEVASFDAVKTDGYFSLQNTTDADIDYHFTVSTKDTTTAGVGYCKIAVITDFVSSKTATSEDGKTLHNVQIFHTTPIWKPNTEGKSSSEEIVITAPAGKSLIVYFISEWGTSAKPENELVSAQNPLDSVQFAP